MSRKSVEYKYNPTIKIDTFDRNTIDKKNIVNQILKIHSDDISSSLIMDLFGNFYGKSLIHHYDTFEVPAKAFSFENSNGKVVSNTKPFMTTFGIWIFNIYFLRDLGFSKVTNGYLNKNLTEDDFEDLHQDLIFALLEDRIDVENYKKFINRCQFFMPFESILSPNHSEKLLSCTKIINKRKAELIKENKIALQRGDAAVAERIEKELLDFALEYLKDDPALDPYLSGAGGNIANDFKNTFIMKGSIRNPDPNAKQEFTIATSSYMDGISAEEYSALANSLPGGPYARAKKTELGGYWEKLVEAANNTVIIDKPGSDCGSDKYIEVVLTKKNLKMFIYSYIIKSDGTLEELNTSNKDKYMNKKIKVRSTLFCKNTKGKVCNCCAGNFFLRRGNPNIGLATAQIPTVLKLKSMKAFHDSTVRTSEIDPMEAFGLK